MAIAIIVIGFLGYLIFIKQQVGKVPAGFVQPIRKFTEEEKIEILKKLSTPMDKDLSDEEKQTLSTPTDKGLPNKEKQGILEKLSGPTNKDLTDEEKMKILESLTQ